MELFVVYIYVVLIILAGAVKTDTLKIAEGKTVLIAGNIWLLLPLLLVSESINYFTVFILFFISVVFLKTPGGEKNTSHWVLNTFTGVFRLTVLTISFKIAAGYLLSESGTNILIIVNIITGVSLLFANRTPNHLIISVQSFFMFAGILLLIPLRAVINESILTFNFSAVISSFIVVVLLLGSVVRNGSSGILNKIARYMIISVAALSLTLFFNISGFSLSFVSLSVMPVTKLILIVLMIASFNSGIYISLFSFSDKLSEAALSTGNKSVNSRELYQKLIIIAVTTFILCLLVLMPTDNLKMLEILLYFYTGLKVYENLFGSYRLRFSKKKITEKIA